MPEVLQVKLIILIPLLMEHVSSKNLRLKSLLSVAQSTLPKEMKLNSNMLSTLMVQFQLLSKLLTVSMIMLEVFIHHQVVVLLHLTSIMLF